MSRKKNSTKAEAPQQIGAWEHALPYLDGSYWIRSFAFAFLVGLVIQSVAEIQEDVMLNAVGWAFIFGGASIFGGKILLVTIAKVLRWLAGLKDRRFSAGGYHPRLDAAASICDRLNPTWLFLIFAVVGALHGLKGF